ncbi:MAG TPA: hypothetical protein VLV89_02005 [Candidatus Acidoferrum sp.]|nr:hypothetical protein [Candidatus Acidoferrum sp.]
MHLNSYNEIHPNRRFTRKYLLTVCALAILAVPVFGQELKWTSFKEPNLKFALLFPGDPVANPPDVKKRDDGSVESTGYYFLTGTASSYVSLAGATDYNFTVNAESELTADRDNFVKAINGKATNSRRYEFLAGDEKLPALSFNVENDSRVGKAIVVVRGNRAYMVVFVYQKGQDYAAAMDKFLESFEITK